MADADAWVGPHNGLAVACAQIKQAHGSRLNAISEVEA